MWGKPCREAGKVTYQDRHSFNKSVRDVIPTFNKSVRDVIPQDTTEGIIWSLFLFPQSLRENPSLRYGIQMDPSVTERSKQSGKKPLLCMLGLLSTIIRGREQSVPESANHGKIALGNEHNWAPITSTSACGVARTSTRCLDHPARDSFCWKKRFASDPSTVTLKHWQRSQ